MSSKVNFYIARHGRTILNELGRVQGWSDTPLIKKGVEVAKYLGIGLRKVNFHSAYCSDLRRTKETITIVLDYLGRKDLTVTEKMNFREVCFGSYESNFTRVMWREAALYLQYRNEEELLNDIFDVSKDITYEQVANTIKKLDQIGIAENFEQVEKRTQEALYEIAEKEAQYGEERNVLIVAHGMCIKFMLQNLAGKTLFGHDLENASICKVMFENGEFKVEKVGDMSYVEEGRAMSKMEKTDFL